jgi:hypothetical protein
VALHVTGGADEHPGEPAVNAIVCDENTTAPCDITTFIEVTFEGRYCGERLTLAVAVAADGIAITIETELLPDAADAPGAVPGTAVDGSVVPRPPPPPQPANSADASATTMSWLDTFFMRRSLLMTA